MGKRNRGRQKGNRPSKTVEPSTALNKAANPPQLTPNGKPIEAQTLSSNGMQSGDDSSLTLAALRGKPLDSLYDYVRDLRR